MPDNEPTQEMVVIDRPAQELRTADNSPGALLRLALERDLDIAKVEKLLELQERYEAMEARKAYVVAMSEFKRADCPVIVKDSHVSFRNSKGQLVEYDHASLAQVVTQCVAALAKHGFHHEWSAKQGQGIQVTCRITHRQGHGEETTLLASADTSGTKNQIQSIASTVTYLERYTLLMALGLAPADDDDGRRSAPVPQDRGQACPPVDRDPPPGPRAKRAIDVWARYIGASNARADMERFLGRPAGQWDDGDFETLLSIWGRVREAKTDEEKTRILTSALTAVNE